MNFISDNAHGAAPEILTALSRANSDPAASYGEDHLTAELSERFAAIFERPVCAYPVTTGTAANALGLATLVPPHGAILCHSEAHIAVDECGAPEFFSHGAKLVPIESPDGKLTADRIAHTLKRFHRGVVHHSQPAAISITQASERGTCYRPEEIAAISRLAQEHGLKLHMDGARFANAIVHLGSSPADATWRSGVDVLSFGGTKNGALCAEAVVFFNPADVADFEYRRKKSGHLVSKMRFLSAQLLASLEEGRWLVWAQRANALARQLGDELRAVDGVRLAHSVDANAVFAWMPDSMVTRLRHGGAQFYEWSPSNDGHTLIRLVCSFATPPDDITRIAALARG